jgi:hypothetical protein
MRIRMMMMRIMARRPPPIYMLFLLVGSAP